MVLVCVCCLWDYLCCLLLCLHLLGCFRLVTNLFGFGGCCICVNNFIVRGVACFLIWFASYLFCDSTVTWVLGFMCLVVWYICCAFRFVFDL